MSQYLIDTDQVVDVLRGHQPAVDLLNSISNDGLAISLITYGELYEGATYARNPSSAHEGLRHFLEGKEVLSINLETMNLFGQVRGRLRQEGRLIGDFDLLIGVTAVQHGLRLITRNRRHFARIPGLEIYPDIEN